MQQKLKLISVVDNLWTFDSATDTPVIPPIDNQTGFKIGTNDFHWVPLDKLRMFETLRLYIASGWCWRPDGLFVQPLYQAETNTVHGLDDYFLQAKQLGIDILPCINQCPDWYAGISNGSGSNNYPPIKVGLDRTDPRSWSDYADFWFQFVARYGSKVHPNSELRVDTTPKYENQPLNIKKSGLGLITKVEINNELDRWWDKGTSNNLAYLYPEEYAAMLYACYQACKKADPDIEVIMGGITGFDLNYLKAMKIAFDKLGVKFQSDKINVHHYSNLYNEYGVWPPTWKESSACYPEEDKDFPMIDKIVEWANTLELKVWCTEFGADTKAPSWMHIHKDGIMDEDAQALLITKTFLAYKKAGVERAYVFTAIDEGGSGLWQTCGLMTSQADGYKLKPSYIAVQKLIESLK